jgi:hypothetical protein
MTNIIIIIFLLMVIIWIIWMCECPLIEETYNEYRRYYNPYFYPGIDRYGMIPYWRRGMYHRLYSPWYDPMDAEEPVISYKYCRRNPDCYPCPGWRFRGPPSCP